MEPVRTQPPTIVLICSDPAAFAPDYRRYLLSVLRDQLPFGEVPIKMYLHKRRQGDDRDFVNIRMLKQNFLHFPRINIRTAGDNQIL